MLAKQYRLRKTNDFKSVFKKGRGVQKDGVLVRVKPAEKSQPRIGIIVSKKVAKKAVARNRIRRVLAEAIRLHLGDMKKNVDVVVVALPDFKAKKTPQAAKTLYDLFKQTSLLK